MMQAHPIPDVHARDRLSVEGMPASPVALLGAREGTDQIELGAGIDDPADAAKNAIHFSKCSKSIDVNRLQAGGLRQQFFVGHDDTPHWTNQNSRTGSSQLSSSVYSTAIILIGSHFVSTTDKPKSYEFGAPIPEAGPCGFDWEDIS